MGSDTYYFSFKDAKYKKILRKIKLGYDCNFNLLIISYFFDVEDNFSVSDFSRDGRFLVIGGSWERIFLVDIKSMKTIRRNTL